MSYVRQFPKESPLSAECKWFHWRKSLGENRKSLFLTSVWQKESSSCDGPLWPCVSCPVSFVSADEGPATWGRWRVWKRENGGKREKKYFYLGWMSSRCCSGRSCDSRFSDVFSPQGFLFLFFSFFFTSYRQSPFYITVALFQLFSVTVRLRQLTVGAWYFYVILHSTNI